jgi:hypothetical protein
MFSSENFTIAAKEKIINEMEGYSAPKIEDQHAGIRSAFDQKFYNYFDIVVDRITFFIVACKRVIDDRCLNLTTKTIALYAYHQATQLVASWGIPKILC